MDNEVREPLVAAWLGQVDYATAWAAQETVFRARMRGEREDSVMLLEHPPTYTLGRRATEDDLVYDRRARAARGIELFEVDRGVTSVLAETGRAHAVEDVARLAARHLGDVFERPVVWAAADSMLGKKSAASAGSR